MSTTLTLYQFEALIPPGCVDNIRLRLRGIVGPKSHFHECELQIPACITPQPAGLQGDVDRESGQPSRW